LSEDEKIVTGEPKHPSGGKTVHEKKKEEASTFRLMSMKRSS
jgi:hypothetical protein